MYFKDVIGQQDIKERLIRSVTEGKVPHALLLAGSEGTGSVQLALAFARYLHCTDKRSDDSCGACSSCKQFDKYIHPDTHFVYPIFKPNSSKKWVSNDFLPNWRTFLSERTYFAYHEWLEHIKAGNAQGQIYADEGDEILRKLSFKPFESEYKVMLIWLPEKMHDTCSNRLLKILEEPPANTVFLLVSEQSGQLLTTILSRTQALRVNGIADEDLRLSLQYEYRLEGANLDACVHLSAGNWLRAKEWIQSTEQNDLFLQLFIRCMRGAYTICQFSPSKKLEKQNSLKELKLWSEDLAKLGRETGKKYLTYAQRLVRENFILNLGNPDLNYLTPGELSFSGRFAPFINHKNVVAFMEELELAEQHIEQNVNAKIVYFDLALKSIMLFKK